MTKKIFLLIFCLILSISIILNFYLYNRLQNQNLVTEVVDGDTFQIKSGRRVRLLGVDAPEYDRCGGGEAREKLTQLILNKKVVLKEEAPETFGRTLALVYQGKTLINEVMLKEGWGRTDYRKNSKRDVLTAAFHFAQKNNLGIFSSLCRELPQQPQSPQSPRCLIKGNIDKNTYQKFYHLPTCKHYNEIVIEKDIGERYFCSEDEALNAGFKKASGCP